MHMLDHFLQIDGAVILAYIRAAGLLPFVLMVTGMVLYVLSQIGTNVWLSDWSADRQAHEDNITSKLKYTKHARLALYGVLGIAQGRRLKYGGG